ncbi:MAG: DNA polymerase III subunit gamma/tau [Clostridiales bacterium]|nr:DNA polymerase III subunit gamma/tau [Clostridiales bacterium]
MKYVALYRKYRPSNFDEVIGQDHIINTLRNQILQDKVSHAYLFTGTRGTGKTSTAKIFARAVNCPHAKEHNGNPCGKCAVCNTVGAANLDIIEMDAASNNGVDYARDIREKVAYPPVNGKYKVYIIDEVHMLSVGAFNALLKTLEEPPAHALFILCTTEVHKIPATILSRCMRFDFRLVPTPVLAQHVCKIYDAEGKEYTMEAVQAIAQAGEGSVRDCVSIADRCYSATGKLTYDDVMSILGVSSQSNIASLCKAVLTNATADILTETNKLVSEGKDVARLNKDLSLYIRDLLTVKLVQDANKILMLPQDVYQGLKELADTVTVKKLLYAIDQLVSLETNLRYALSPLMLFEATALKVASSSGEVDYEGLNTRLTRLEQLPQNISAESKGLYVVDKTDPKSIWRGVKMSIDAKNEPLLSGVWRDVKVEFDSQGNYVIKCGEGSYWLIENKYKRIIQAEVAVLCDNKVVIQLEEQVSDSDVEKQLNGLGKNVTFDDKK